ncbi:hypothetical protein ACEPAI_7592 [Sanghuangporus weigelae]
MFYSSLYRSFLTSNNATGEGQGPFANTASPYFDSLYSTSGRSSLGWDYIHLSSLDTFVERLDHFFNAGYYLAGNEPSFQTPVGYHYANRPTKSVDRVCDVVFSNFDITPAGLPGNDDQAAMATLVIFQLLGLYPGTHNSKLLILSPFTPKYTIYNPFMNSSTTVTVHNFDARSIQRQILSGVAAYVANVTINGVPTATGRCHFDLYDMFRLGGEIEITLTSEKDKVDDCAGSVPDSLSADGFAVVSCSSLVRALATSFPRTYGRANYLPLHTKLSTQIDPDLTRTS